MSMIQQRFGLKLASYGTGDGCAVLCLVTCRTGNYEGQRVADMLEADSINIKNLRPLRSFTGAGLSLMISLNEDNRAAILNIELVTELSPQHRIRYR